MDKFRKLGISESIIKVIEEHKFHEPSEIQEKSIPLILEGKDVIAGAATGSGKTLAFASKIIHDSKPGKGIQALVLTPTRELAEQVAKALERFSKHKSIKISAIYGGVSINPQIHDLEEAEVVVGTPGRILDHMERRTISLEDIKILVLDEADRMLDMGFIEDVVEIINSCPKERQTMLFSATISQDIAHIAEKYMKNPVEVSAESYVDPSKLTQVYYDVPDNMRFSLLVYLLENEKSNLIMVFCNSRKNVDFVVNNLKFLNINALAIHGGFSQDKRTRIMEEFHSAKALVLVCTDVAARGLDIKNVSHVYNYDIPADSKEYVHRIGRTARAGKEGKAINLVSSRDYQNFTKVLKDNEVDIKSEALPEIERVRIRWMPEKRFERDSRRSGGFRGGGFSRGRSSYGGGQRRNYGSGSGHSGGYRRESREESRDGGHGRSHGSSFRRPGRSYRR